MEDGIYTRMEVRMEVYQIEDTEKAIVILFNDRTPNEPIILRDERAVKFVQDMMSLIDTSK